MQRPLQAIKKIKTLAIKPTNLKVGFLCLLIISIMLAEAMAGVLLEPPDNLWKGLIAEACSEGYIGMYAVACVTRNRMARRMNHGLVAMKRKDLNQFIKRQGVKYEHLAKSIIEEVFYRNGKDITQGAYYYENIHRFGAPMWAKTMVVTIVIGKHTFYKERR